MNWQDFTQLYGSQPALRAGIIAMGGIIAALILSALFRRVLIRITRQTDAELDDILVHPLHIPVVVTVAIVALQQALLQLQLSDSIAYMADGILVTTAVATWSMAASQIASKLLKWLARRPGVTTAFTPRTVPVFEITAKIVVALGGIYFVLLAWGINPTAWLASAGILGVAIGFAAQDTLSNVVAGVFILAEAPFKLGDFLVLSTGERGRVVEIGMRTTRMLTLDDVEIIIPNTLLANARITNQSGGPHEHSRVSVGVTVAYGVDLDEVQALLLSITENVVHICTVPAPRVRIRNLADFGIYLDLLVWVEKPEHQGAVVDQLYGAIYKKFQETGTEIPYPRQDITLLNTPGTD